MDVYIVRHAIAEEQSSTGKDADRELTNEGKEKMKEAAAGFAGTGPKIDRILSSPLPRARQTAEIVARELGKEVSEMKEMAPGHTPADVCGKLKSLKKYS